MIIMLKHMICTMFHINPKYPETILLLQNFVKEMSEKIYSEKVRMDVPLSSVMVGGYSKPLMYSAPKQITLRVVEHGHHTIPFNTAKHSGYAFSKRGGPVLVMNNATTFNTVKTATKDLSDDTQNSDDSSYSIDIRRQKSFGRTYDKQRSKSPRNFEQSRKSPSNSQIMGEELGRKSPEKPPSRILQSTDPPPLSKTDWSSVTWSKEEIREFLHPGYPISSMPKQISIVQRSLSVTNTARTRSVIKYVNSPYPYCRYRHFQSASNTMNPLSTLSQTGKSDVSPMVYKELLDDTKKSKEKWVSGKDFQRIFRSTSRLEVKTPFALEPLLAKMKHQFRDTQKNKWIAGVFKTK